MYYLNQYNKATQKQHPRWSSNFQFFIERITGHDSVTTILSGIKQ